MVIVCLIALMNTGETAKAISFLSIGYNNELTLHNFNMKVFVFPLRFLFHMCFIPCLLNYLFTLLYISGFVIKILFNTTLTLTIYF